MSESAFHVFFPPEPREIHGFHATSGLPGPADPATAQRPGGDIASLPTRAS